MCVCSCVSACPCISMCSNWYVCFSVSLFLCVCSISVYFCFCFYVFLSLFLCICVLLCVYIGVYLCMCLYILLCMCVSIGVNFYICMYVCLSVHLGTSEKRHLTWISPLWKVVWDPVLALTLEILQPAFISSFLPPPYPLLQCLSLLSARLLFIFPGKTCPVFPEAAGTWPQRVG